MYNNAILCKTVQGKTKVVKLQLLSKFFFKRITLQPKFLLFFILFHSSFESQFSSKSNNNKLASFWKKTFRGTCVCDELFSVMKFVNTVYSYEQLEKRDDMKQTFT